MSIELTIDQSHSLAIQPALGTTENSTFITIASGSVQDFFGNSVPTIPGTDAFQAAEVVADETGPVLTGFTLDVNIGQLNLTFSETINATTFDATGLTLLGAAESSAVRYTLTAGDITEDHYSVSLNLSTTDLNTIKLLSGLGNATSDTYLSVSSSAAEDLSGNSAVTIPPSQAIRASDVIPDETPPELISFSLDLTTDTLSLTFTEVVASQTLDTTQVTLQSTATANPATENITIQSVPAPENNSDVISVTLLASDLNDIKGSSFLGDHENYTFIAITSAAVQDLAGNDLRPIPTSSGLMASSVIPDREPPFLTNFTLDLGLATLSLTFSEVIDSSTVNVTRLMLQNRLSTPTATYSLTSTSSVDSSTSDTVTISLSVRDLNTIKLADLGNDVTDTFLLTQNDTIADIAGNYLVEPEMPLAAYDVLPDEIPPVLLTFTLDLNTSQLILTFQEAVDVSSLNVSGLMIIPGRGTIDPLRSLVISNTTVSGSTLGDVVYIDLTMTDDIFLKVTSGVGDTINNTYLTVENASIYDASGIAIEPVTLLTAVQAEEIVEDETAPELLEYSLDLNNGYLTLTFDEPISAASLEGESVVFTDSSNSSAVVTTLALQPTTSANSSENFLSISLLQQDLDRVKPLARDNVFLRLLSGAISDISNNPIETISLEDALTPASIVNDSTRPQLLMFNIDLTNGNLTLYFSEAPDPTTTDLSQLTLQDASTALDVQFSLSGGVVEPHATITSALSVELNTPDLNEIYRLDICTGADDCYLSFTDVFIADYASNRIIGREDGEAVNVSVFGPDTPPVSWKETEAVRAFWKVMAVKSRVGFTGSSKDRATPQCPY